MLFDAATGAPKAALVGATNGGIDLDFHPAGNLLASEGWEGRLRLWDAMLGRPVLSLTAECSAACDFSQDGRIAVSLEGKMTIYDVDPALEYRSFRRGWDSSGEVDGLSIHRDGRLLAVGTDDGVALWDMVSGRELANLAIGQARHVLFERSGGLLTSGASGLLRWPVHLDRERDRFQIGPPQIVLAASGRCIIAQDESNQILARANFTLAEVFTSGRTTRVSPLDDCRSVTVSPDGRWLATGSHSRGAQVFRVSDGAREIELPIVFGTAVRFSPDGKWLLTAASPCRLWAVGTWVEQRQIEGAGHCFSPDGRYLLVQDVRKALVLVECASGRTVARLESPDSCNVSRATFSPDGSRLALTTLDGPAVHVWDLRAIRRRLASMGLDWDAPAYSDHDPADPTAPPLPPLQVDLGPLARDLDH